MPRRLLVVDDDAASCRLVRAIFTAEGYEVNAAGTGQDAIRGVAATLPHIVLLDLQLPDMTGLDVLDQVRQAHPEIPVVMLTAHGDIRTAVRATQLGAADYLTKPIDPDELAIVVRRCVETSALRTEVEDLRRQLGQGGALGSLMGPSREVRAVVDQVQRVAETNFSVLILGETGTGKELVAQAIHRQSDRRTRPFVALDCGAIPEALMESELFGHERGAFTGADKRREGHFRLAEGGTLFLDEVGNLPVALQSKLLRVLESRQLHAVGAAKATELDVRFVAATNEDLLARVTAAQFRMDLYFRLAQYTITLPALRHRSSDIAFLAQRFLAEVSVELRRPVHGIAQDALDLLQRHPWPGNVRELRNVLRRAVLEAPDVVLQRADLERGLGLTKSGSKRTEPDSAPTTLKEVAEAAAREAERTIICDTLRRTAGNKSQAARALQTDYKTLHLKMRQMGIDVKEFTS